MLLKQASVNSKIRTQLYLQVKMSISLILKKNTVANCRVLGEVFCLLLFFAWCGVLFF